MTENHDKKSEQVSLDEPKQIESIDISTDDITTVKEKNSGLSYLTLLISFLALGVSVYHAYFQRADSTYEQQKNWQPDIDQLTQRLLQTNDTLIQQSKNMEKLSSDFLNFNSQQSTANESADIKLLINQIDGLSQELELLKEKVDQNSYANDSEGLAGDQLTRLPEFQSISDKLKQLENNLVLAQQKAQNVPEKQLSASDKSFYAILARQQLLIANYYMQLDQPEAVIKNLTAIRSLEFDNYFPSLSANIKNIIQRVKTTVSVDEKSLMTQLQQIRSKVNKLQMVNETNKVNTDKWYDKFVSIHKIDSQARLKGLAEVDMVKSELSNSLIMAEWALKRRNQSQWTSYLQFIVQMLSEKFPDETVLLSEVKKLQEKAVLPDYPDLSGLISSFDTIIAQQT